MKFLENLKAVVALLGLGPQFAAGKLSPEEQASLIKAYEDSTKGSFKDDLEAWQKEQKEAADNQAMAEAFREGNLGIMDYYNMLNVQADTEMRKNIAQSEEPAKPTEEN